MPPSDDRSTRKTFRHGQTEQRHRQIPQWREVAHEADADEGRRQHRPDAPRGPGSRRSARRPIDRPGAPSTPRCAPEHATTTSTLATTTARVRADSALPASAFSIRRQYHATRRAARRTSPEHECFVRDRDGTRPAFMAATAPSTAPPPRRTARRRPAGTRLAQRTPMAMTSAPSTPRRHGQPRSVKLDRQRHGQRAKRDGERMERRAAVLPPHSPGDRAVQRRPPPGTRPARWRARRPRPHA